MDRKLVRGALGAPARSVFATVLVFLLAATMMPAGGISPAFADEPAAGDAPFAADGLLYTNDDNGATLVGFEDGSALAGAVVVPETVGDGDGAVPVVAVEIAEGQAADKVTALALPQAVESVRTEGLAAALPALASIEVASGVAAEGDGDATAAEAGAAGKGAYSSVAGMLFRSAEGQASSDGEAFAEDALELVWAPPAMVVARIPLECKAIAAGAFVDAASLETVMSFGKMESIASAERDGEGDVTKPGAFADEQISRLTIVVPGTNYAVTGEGAERVSGSVALSEKTDMLEKRKAWFHHGFDTGQIIMGAPFGEIEGVNAVSDEGVMEDRSLVTPLENGRSHLELTPEEEAEKAERRGEDPEAGLSFSYQASMDLSVRWAGDKTATPARVEMPAYAKVDGVTYQVTQIEPNAFEGAVFLASVTIPEGVTAIGESAFAGCTNLKSVSLPSTLKTIDYAAFKGTALESITIPEGTAYIGGEAFAECENLVSAEMLGTPTIAATAGISELGLGSDSGEIQLSNRETEDDIAAYASESHLSPVGHFRNFTVMYVDADGYHAHHEYPSFQGQARPYDGITLTSPAGCPYMYAEWNTTWGDSNLTYIGHHSRAGVFTGSDHKCQSFFPFHGTTMLARGLRFFTWSESQNSYVFDGRRESAVVDYYLGGNVLVQFDFAGGTGDGTPLTYISLSPDKTFGTLPTATRDGYRFVGWTLDGNPVNSGSTIPGEGIYTLVADWEVAADVALEGVPGSVALEEGSLGDVASLEGGKLSISDDLWDADPEVWAKVDPSGDLKLYTQNNTASENHICTLKAPSDSNYHFEKWVIDGTDLTASSNMLKLSNSGAHSFKLVYPANAYRITYNVGAGGWVSDATNVDEYTFGVGRDLRDASRVKDAPGFWFAGWQLAVEGSGSLGSSVPDGSATTTKVAADAHGNITAHAVWKPITYQISFVTSAAGYKQLPNTDENLVIAKPNGGSQTFVHPTAYDKIAEASDPQFGQVDTANHFDLTVAGIEGMCGADGYKFAVPDDLLGYDWKGWTSTTDVALDQDATAYYVMREGDTGTRFRTFFGDAWSAPSRDNVQNAFAYSLWHSVPLSTIELGSGIRANVSGGAEIQDVHGQATGGTYEPHKNNVGETLPVDGVEASSPSIRWWPGRGLVGTSPAAAVEGVPSEAIDTLTPSRMGSKNDDGSYEGMRLDAKMNLKAPVRYGFQFLGWGTDADDEGKLYIKYEENYSGDPADSKFSLTDQGAEVMHGWEAAWDAAGEDADARAGVNAEAAQKWVACWRVRTVDVALRVPLHAVSEADMTGASTGPGATHGDAADFAAGVTKGEYDDYTWREGTSAETGGGATAGWYIASRTWRYGDLLEYPAFKTQPDRYTYDGWYHLQKPSVTDSTDKALEDLAGTGADLTKVATYQAMKALSSIYVTGGNTAGGGAFATDAGLDVGDAYFTVGDPSAKNAHDGGAAVELWLWTSPVRINVASPLGVWLCTTNSYGQAVEPYVVGNDRRTQLEAQAEFQVSTSSHDLQLVDVTAEDIIAYAYNDDKTVNADSVISQANPTAPDEGICDKIMNPKFGVKDAGDNRYEDETSRMFWVSPVPTATADQTGVVYRSEGLTAAEAASKVSTTPSMTDAETLLEPDVATRRYFGFGSKDAGGNADNRITDELSSEHGNEANYELGDFILRKSYVNGVTDGLAKTSEEGGVSKYRFYYGLDMRRADFDLAGLQDVIDNGGHGLAYNAAFDQPLLRVKFTFAAARNPGISYYSARLSDGEAEAYDAFAEAAGGKISDAVEISAGAPTDL